MPNFRVHFTICCFILFSSNLKLVVYAIFRRILKKGKIMTNNILVHCIVRLTRSELLYLSEFDIKVALSRLLVNTAAASPYEFLEFRNLYHSLIWKISSSSKIQQTPDYFFLLKIIFFICFLSGQILSIKVCRVKKLIFTLPNFKIFSVKWKLLSWNQSGLRILPVCSINNFIHSFKLLNNLNRSKYLFFTDRHVVSYITVQ